MDRQNSPDVKKETIGAIILAAGKGTRMNSTDKNKVTHIFHGKPIIQYGVDLMESVANHVVVVVGAYSESVKDALKDHPAIIFADQTEQLGTGHALKVGFQALEKEKPDYILLGYGDHLMFYKTSTVSNFIKFHKEHGAAVSFLTTHYDDPEKLAWAHIERDEKNGHVVNMIEHKDATNEQKKIREVNPGFYCFNYDFLNKYIEEIKPSEVTKEYYLTDLFRIAWDHHIRIAAMPVPFDEVGIGINKFDELEESQKLYSSRS